jgi:hypothetical protein
VFDRIYGLRGVGKGRMTALILMSMGSISTPTIISPYKRGFGQLQQIATVIDYNDKL